MEMGCEIESVYVMGSKCKKWPRRRLSVKLNDHDKRTRVSERMMGEKIIELRKLNVK